MSEPKSEPKPWPEFVGNEKRKWMIAGLCFEWMCEHIAYRLSKWAFVEVLEYAGKLSVIVAMILYVFSADERREAADTQRKLKQYQAWQVINSARGSQATSGRVEALHDLHKGKVSLVGVDLTHCYLPLLTMQGADFSYGHLDEALFENANLSRSHFIHASLANAQLADAKLTNANFALANLFYALLAESDLRHATFNQTEMGGTILTRANLSGAVFTSASFTNALAFEADLHDAVFMATKLHGTDFTRANLAGTFFDDCELDNADFSEALLTRSHFRFETTWQKIGNLKNANVFGVANAPEGFMEWATNKMGAVAVRVDSYDQWENWLRAAKNKPNDLK